MLFEAICRRDDRRLRLARLAAPVLLAASFLAMALGTAPPAGAVPPSVSAPRTDGATVVWIRYYYYPTLYYQRVGSDQVQTGPDYVDYPDVSGDLMVWEDYGISPPSGPLPITLGGMHLSDGSPLALPTGPGDQLEPAISGTRLVWVNHDPSDSAAPWKLLTTDLAASSSPVVLATMPGSVTQVGQPVIAGDHVLWTADTDLWLVSLSGGAPVRIGPAGQSPEGYDLAGNLLVYSNQDQVHLIDLTSLAVDKIIGDAGRTPTTDGRYVFWEDTSLNSGTQRAVVGYDTQTDSTFNVAAGPDQFNWAPRARGGTVVWMYAPLYVSGGDPQIHALHDVLPSARQPDPGKSDPNWTYYPLTGHYLAAGFRAFWQQSGGLPVFGYPLTEEFSQHGFTVQYLERQRFEYHPEFAGTPYETELGLLGSEDAARRGLLGTAPFQPLAMAHAGDCHFFAETRQSVCGDFLAYWQSHGLNFGDPGISYRESLALFGYPISDEFTDPATGLIVQYFERAVFEHHPNNPDPYKVELRLLGAQQLQSYGW